MARTAWLLAAVLVFAACNSPDRAGLCDDLLHLDATVEILVSPPPNATVGEIRGALEKLDSTVTAVHHDDAVPDAEDDALYDAQQAYEDAIVHVGDDDAFAPHAAATAEVAQTLGRSYQAVRTTLACPSASAT